MPYYLAIDAGGTKADYLLADDTRELARVRSGTIKRMRADEATCAANLNSGLTELSLLSGVPLDAIACTCIGTAGETVPLVTGFLREALTARVSGSLILLGDIEIALDAAFPGQPGVVVIAGTGSNVAGRDIHGQLTTAGGWGPALADQGSGHRIGLEALRATCLALDEGRSTTLLPAILDLWQLSSPPEGIDQLVAHANRIPAPDFSRLTTAVLACAQQGDPTASAVLEREGHDLAHLVRLVLRRIKLTGPNVEPDPTWTPPLAFTGSILEKVAPVREALTASVQQEFPTIQIHPNVIDPIAGALFRARQGN
jgi:N-acetylglucosamine kinase-like BadF-type ATPase